MRLRELIYQLQDLYSAHGDRTVVWGDDYDGYCVLEKEMIMLGKVQAGGEEVVIIGDVS